MMRLLGSDDYEFLASQPGYDPRLARKLRAARRRVARDYLRAMSRDFDRICAAFRLLMVYSGEDRPELALALIKQRLAFWFGINAARWALALDVAGMGRLDLVAVLRPLESVRGAFSRLDPAAVPVS